MHLTNILCGDILTWFYRYGGSLKVTREVACHSASAVSSDELDQSSDIEISATPARVKGKLPVTHTVTEPKHKAVTKHCADAATSLASLGEFLKQKSLIEDRKSALMEEKAARERKLRSNLRGRLERGSRMISGVVV